MVPGVPCVDRGNWGRERDITFGVLRRKFWQVSRLIYTFISHTEMSIFFRMVGPRVLFLKASQVSSCSKRARETSLTLLNLRDINVNYYYNYYSCGFRCYYLEHCSKTNHIAIKFINTKTSMDS